MWEVGHPPVELRPRRRLSRRYNKDPPVVATTPLPPLHSLADPTSQAADTLAPIVRHIIAHAIVPPHKVGPILEYTTLY